MTDKIIIPAQIGAAVSGWCLELLVPPAGSGLLLAGRWRGRPNDN